MKSKKPSFLLSLILLLSLGLAACSGSASAQPAAAAPKSEAAPAESQAAQAGNNTSSTSEGAPAGYWIEEQPQSDQQGAVTIEIIPVKLNNPGSRLDFEVRMNTHSVDLSMNLAELASLTTDTGKTVQAIGWDAPAGGHHVSGKLSFPAGVDGAPLLDGVRKLTLTITNVDAPERVFVWEK